MKNTLKIFFIGGIIIIIIAMISSLVKPDTVAGSQDSTEELDSLILDAKMVLDSSQKLIARYSCKCIIEQTKRSKTVTTKLYCIEDDEIISNYYETVVTSDEPLIKSAVEYIKARTYIQEKHPNCLIEYKGF